MRSPGPTTFALATALVLATCGGGTDEAASPEGETTAAEDTTAPVDTAGPGAPAARAAADTVAVEPVDLPDASGTLVVRAEADTVRLTLAMSGLEAGTRYLPNVHEGRCGGRMGPAVGSLQPVTGAGADTVTTTGTIPASDLASDRSYFVEVHGAGTAACIDLPTGGSATG